MKDEGLCFVDGYYHFNSWDHILSDEELEKEEDLFKKQLEDPKQPLISELVTKFESMHIQYPRQYVERKILYKINVGKTREQAIEELYKEEDLHEKHIFSLEDHPEKRILELEGGWRVVRHGRRFNWSNSIFLFELLRKPILTNKRIILLNGEEIDYELPIRNVLRAEEETVAAGNSCLRIELKNGDAVSLDFVCSDTETLFDASHTLNKQRTLVNQWLQSVNNLIK